MNNQNQSLVIFFLHGLGGTAWLRKPYVRKLSKSLPYNLKFILPQAKIFRFNFSELYQIPLFLTA